MTNDKARKSKIPETMESPDLKGLPERIASQEDVLRGIDAKHFSTLLDAAIHISKSLELEEVLENVLKNMIDLIGVQRGAVLDMSDPEYRAQIIHTKRPVGLESLRETWSDDIVEMRSYPYSLEHLQSGHAIQINVEQEDAPPEELRFLREQNLKSMLLVPLVMQGKQIGLVALMDGEKCRRFTQNDIGVVQVLATHAAIAIQNARYYQSARQRAADLEIVRQAALSVTSSLRLTDVLYSILEHTLSVLPNMSDAHIFLYENGRLRFGAALWEDGRADEPWAEPRETGLTYTVARSGEEIIIDDMQADPFYASIPSNWVGSIVGLPLKIKGEVIGVMNVANPHTHAFHEDQLQVLRLLADQAAIAIENARLHNLANRQARSDTLTDLHNRRALDEKLAEEIFRSERYQREFSIFMMDLNDFKRINDSYGHPVGDRVLRQFAHNLREQVRATDYLARYGGDEFALILPETGYDEARHLASRLKEVIEQKDLIINTDKTVRLTMSIGVSTFPTHGKTAEELVSYADQQLYRFKGE
jgi:diguanylate cyclase (GGDEF)-like protein